MWYRTHTKLMHQAPVCNYSPPRGIEWVNRIIEASVSLRALCTYVVNISNR